MKNKALILFFILLSAGAALAQRIQNFNLFLDANNSVIVKFTIGKGSQCAGYNILWSPDSINYSPIYNYSGVCGDVTVDQDYSFAHGAPAQNQVNFYKIDLNGVETSPPKRIYVGEIRQNLMLLYPNPVLTHYDLLNFKIYNASNIRVVGFVFNQFGKPVGELDLKTQGDTGSLPVFALENGLYVLWVTDGTNVYRSKFIVFR